MIKKTKCNSEAKCSEAIIIDDIREILYNLHGHLPNTFYTYYIVAKPLNKNYQELVKKDKYYVSIYNTFVKTVRKRYKKWRHVMFLMTLFKECKSAKIHVHGFISVNCSIDLQDIQNKYMVFSSKKVWYWSRILEYVVKEMKYKDGALYVCKRPYYLRRKGFQHPIHDDDHYIELQVLLDTLISN